MFVQSHETPAVHRPMMMAMAISFIWHISLQANSMCSAQENMKTSVGLQCQTQ